MEFIKLTFTIIFLLLSTVTKAADLLAEIGYHTGGDTLASGISANNGTETLDGGDGFSIAAGYDLIMGDSTELFITLGMKKDVVYPDDGTLSFVRYPVDMLLSFGSGRLKYGLGATYHLNPLYKKESLATNQTIKFKHAMGYMFDIRYIVFDRVFVSGRYTKIEYEIDGSTSNSAYDGSSIGLLVGINL